MNLKNNTYFRVIVLSLLFILLSVNVSSYASGRYETGSSSYYDSSGYKVDSVSSNSTVRCKSDSISSSSSIMEPRSLTINVEDRILGKFYYDNFEVNVQKIVSAAGIGYCLDLNKDYPYGQRFSSYEKSSEDVNNILSNGYPNRSAEELDVSDDDEGYLATQIALWALFEGYNIDDIDTGNEDVNAAAKVIYTNGFNKKGYDIENDTIIYKCGNSSIQAVVIYVSQPIEIMPIPPVEEVPPVTEEKPTIDSGTGGVNDNKPVGKGR